MVKKLDAAPGARGTKGVVVAPVVPYPPIGGGEKRTLRLLEAMGRAGVQPHVVTAHEGGDPEGLRRRGYQVEVLPAAPPGLRARAAQHARRLPSPFLGAVAARVGALASSGAAFVQLEHAQSAYYLDALGGVPAVLSMHNVDSALLSTVERSAPPFSLDRARAWNRWHSTRAVERRAVPRVDTVLCVSERDRAHFAAHAREVLLAPNGVDDELFTAPELGISQETDEDVLFFGRLDYGPNARGLRRFLLEGWPRVANARPRARLRVAGAGIGTELRRAASSRERIELLGVVPDILTELARARAVVVPLWEGGGTRLKVLESLAAGRPVVGTALGVEQIGFRDGEHGLVGETPGELADGIVTSLEDPPRARELAVQGRRLAERYRWAETLRPVEDLYRRLLADAH